VLDAEAKQNQARLALSEAQLEQARLELGYTELRAPADGIIGKRSLREGLYVQSGMQVASLVPLSGVGRGQLQGDPVAAHAAGPEGGGDPGCLSGSAGRGDHRQPLSQATGAKFALLPPENATGNFTKIVQRVPVKIRIPDPGALAGKLLPASPPR
jgi:membrane fusion protein (multidrug efflux system)